MKLSRKTKLNIAAAAFLIGFVLLAADKTETTTLFTFLTIKGIGMLLLTSTAYICNKDAKEHGIQDNK